MAKTTPRMSEHWECVFCPSTFSKKDDRDKHLDMCAGARLFCKYDGCFYNTDKRKNLQRHVRNKHVDTKQEEYKSKELVDTSDSNESEEWERQDPGEVIKTTSGTESEESESKGTDKDDTEVTPEKESSETEKNISDDLIKVTVEKENETIRKVVCRNDDPVAVSAVQVGRTIRQKTSPRLPGKRSEAEKRNIKPISTKGSNETVDMTSSVQEGREDSCADHIESLENNNIVKDIAASQESTRPSNVKVNIDANTTQVKVNIEMSMPPAKVKIDVSIEPALQQVLQEIHLTCDAQLPTIPEPQDQQGTYRFIWKGEGPGDPRNMDVMLMKIDDEKFGIQATN
ncbi:MECOM [Mytilus coruscus]|uniref:MECOM n=1 Tax=Mytilus coruscus TaxID=42192 RepID=A0A6J8EG10_MYTCO|nr:MECOM [Mytilus coruscus]